MKHIKPILNPKEKVKQLVLACISNDTCPVNVDVCTNDGEGYCSSGDICGDCQATDYCPNGDSFEPECGCDTCFAGDETECTFDGC
jgi:hypothetical protein